MNKYVAIGGDPAFGTDAADLQINGQPQSIGLLQSCSAEDGGDKWEGKDGNGNTCRTVLFNKSGSLNASLFIDNGAALPERGDTFEVGGREALIDSVKISWSNNQGTSVEISGSWSEHVDTSIVTTVAES